MARKLLVTLCLPAPPAQVCDFNLSEILRTQAPGAAAEEGPTNPLWLASWGPGKGVHVPCSLGCTSQDARASSNHEAATLPGPTQLGSPG